MFGGPPPLAGNMAGAQGVEPRPHEPESRVLPLDNAPALGLSGGYNRFWEQWVSSSSFNLQGIICNSCLNEKNVAV